jgi:hypothetical protein
MNQPRIFVTTAKNISTYRYKETGEMIRMGEAVYEEILLKGKKAQKYPDDITAAIKKTPHYCILRFCISARGMQGCDQGQELSFKINHRNRSGFHAHAALYIYQFSFRQF